MTAREDAVTAVEQLAAQAAADRQLLQFVAASITDRVDAWEIARGGRSFLKLTLPEDAMRALDQVPQP